MVSDDEDIFPNREIYHDNEYNEQSYEENNPLIIFPEECTDGLPPYRSKPNPSFIGNYLPARSGKNLRKTLKHVLKDKVSRLEAKVKESHSNTLGMKEEIKTLKGELLLWVNKWKEMKLKKDKHRVVKISSVANEFLHK